MRGNYYYFLLTLVVLLGFLVRLYKIDSPIADWHSWRQADTASVSRFYVQDGINLLYPRYQDISFLQTGIDNPKGLRFVEFPIFNAIHALLVKGFPFQTLEFWGRLLSVLCSSISIILVFVLGKKFLGLAGGLLSAFFFAFLPFNIYFSRVILPDGMSVMFGLAALVAFVFFLDKQQHSSLTISIVLFALALLVKPHAIFFGIPMLWLAFGKFGIVKTFKKRSLWLFGMALLPLIAWRLWILQYPEGIPHYSWMYQGWLRFRPAFFRWIFGERIGRLILGEWGLILFAVGLLVKSKNSPAYFPLVMFIGSFVYMFVLAEVNVRHDYYQVFIIPAIALVLSRGVIEMWQNSIFNKLLSRLLVTASIIFMLGFSWYQVREFYKINHPEIIDAGKSVASLTPPDALIVAPYNGDTALLYHTQRSGWPYLTYSIEQLIDMGATYYVSVNPQSPETQDAYRKFIVIKETDKYVVIKLEPKPKN